MFIKSEQIIDLLKTKEKVLYEEYQQNKKDLAYAILNNFKDLSSFQYLENVSATKWATVYKLIEEIKEMDESISQNEFEAMKKEMIK